MTRQNLVVVLVVAAAAVGTGALTAVGIAGGGPDFLVAVLFLVLSAAAVDGAIRGRVTGRHGTAYPLTFAVLGAAVGVATLAVGATVSGVVLLAVAAGALALFALETRRARTEPPAPQPDPR